MLNNLKSELKQLANPIQAAQLQRFFKTGKGEYGEGDIFLGLKMPMQRKVAKKYLDIKLSDIQKLLDSEIHEHRMTGLLILLYKYKKASATHKASQKLRKDIYKLYMKNYNNINNWDLVDVTCPHIVGDYLQNKDRKILYSFAKSNHLWKKRIAMISCLAFIRNKDFTETIKFAEILLKDEHDLIHKAVGWMLREMGKRDIEPLYKFLDKYAKQMPRTMLRYSIEQVPEQKRLYYLNSSK